MKVIGKTISILIFILFIYFFCPQSFAQNCSGTPDDGQGCTNGGNLTNGCNWICNEIKPEIKYILPPCCETLAATGDPFACCFDARRRCTPDQCSSISGAQQRCGQLWTGDWNCPQTMQPIATPKPTIQPTVIPTKKPIPSKVPTEKPTSTVPTAIPLPMPTEKPVTQQETLPSFPTSAVQNEVQKSTNIIFPCLKNSPYVSISSLNLAARKPMIIIEYVFRKILYYDRKLENTTNEWLKKIL